MQHENNDYVSASGWSNAAECSGSIWLDFLRRLLLVFAMIAPALTILAVVAWRASHLHH